MLPVIQNNSHPQINDYLPHNFLAEKAILSSLIVNSHIIETTLKTLPVDAFYFRNHQELYSSIIDMHQNKMSIDVLTLLTFLQDSGRLEKVGGVNVLIELLSQVPNLIYFEEYLGLVKDKFIRRSLIKLGYTIINSSYITNIPLETILQDFEVQLFDLTNEKKPQKVLSSAEILSEIFFNLKQRSLDSTAFGLNSGFYDLDSMTQGFQKSDLIIVAGRPSIGKTAFGLNIALNILKKSKLPTVFFSLEMSKEQLIYRLLTMESNISQTQLRSGKLFKEDWIKLNKIIKIFSKLPLFIDDSSQLSITDIKSKIKTIAFEQSQIGLIVIDYLQLINNDLLQSENRVQELSRITRSLKMMAREFKVPIIALSQLSRNVENRIDQKPILSDLRESGSIEQDADVVLMLYKNQNTNLNIDSNHQLIELIIAKQRNGPTGTVQLEFNQSQTKFLNPSESNLKDLNLKTDS